MYKSAYLYSAFLLFMVFNPVNSYKLLANENEQIYYSRSQQLLNKKYKISKPPKDTLVLVKWLVAQSNINRASGHYDLAFDNLWEALLLAEQKSHTKTIVRIYRGIGLMYDIYNKDSLALDYFQKAISQANKLPEKTVYFTNQQISNYFSTSNFWRDREDYERALTYLDSCYLVKGASSILPHALTDQGYCNFKLGNLNIAEKQLRVANSILEKNKSPYVVINLSFIGDLKKSKFQYDSALYYYSQSLEIMEGSKVHTEHKSELLEKMSEIYTIKGDLNNAVSTLKESKRSFEKLFGATSEGNQRLFEIKNKYQAKLHENMKIIANQEIVIDKKNRKFTLLMYLFGLSIIISIGIYVFFYQRNRIKKISLVSRLDSEKNKAILHVKSKELTTYALKMVKMEDSVQYLLKTVKEKVPNAYQHYQQNFSQVSANSWEEFNQRFTEVNTNFYEILYKKHPDLTSTEIKHCALIKLNFDSHEMSKIMNISLRSIHTSRYRIRKKIGLNSNSSLTSYIGSIA